MRPADAPGLRPGPAVGRPRPQRAARLLGRHGGGPRARAGALRGRQHVPLPPLRPLHRLRHLRPGVLDHCARASRPLRHLPDVPVLAEPLRAGHVADRMDRRAVAARGRPALAAGRRGGGHRADRAALDRPNLRRAGGPTPPAGRPARPGRRRGQRLVVGGHHLRRPLRDPRHALRAVVRLLALARPDQVGLGGRDRRGPLRRRGRPLHPLRRPGRPPLGHVPRQRPWALARRRPGRLRSGLAAPRDRAARQPRVGRPRLLRLHRPRAGDRVELGRVRRPGGAPRQRPARTAGAPAPCGAWWRPAGAWAS